jgi:hypothetical protein
MQRARYIVEPRVFIRHTEQRSFISVSADGGRTWGEPVLADEPGGLLRARVQ